MEIEIHSRRAHREQLPLPPNMAGRAGAWVEFRGLVRGEEAATAILALEYEAYSPMAEREMRRILEEVAGCQPCLYARVIHRTGMCRWANRRFMWRSPRAIAPRRLRCSPNSWTG